MRLCCETLKYHDYLERFLDDKKVALFVDTDAIGGSREFALVVLYEMVVGKGYKFFGSKLKAAARQFQEAVEAHKAKLAAEGITASGCAEESVSEAIPRYVRVNTLVVSVDEVLENLQIDGWKVKTCNASNFATTFKSLGKRDVLRDPHVDDLLVFPTKTDLHAHPLVASGGFVLQDKASCLPAFVLAPKPGEIAFDACAAPGNKTSHMAALMENKGKIYACDLSDNRINTLHSTMKTTGTTIARVAQGDFLGVEPSEAKFANLKYIIVDPPCSGSGIAKRADFLSKERKSVDRNRLNKLHNLQVMLLRHAFKFPGVERIVYSTCSIHEEENEDVVAEMLGTDDIYNNFQLVDPLSSWTHRGNDRYDFGDKVLRADPATDLTNGFFVALFARRTD
uniref:SAM_MT_RSMB_NOP domain-containing protein n=1 Tax=Panagrellus redivivus TaxID=6233 RepID=A0A7E4V855_PANRE